MKAFTLWQPWASLVMVGAKPWEFRNNSFLDRRSYRNGPEIGERVVLQAGARPVKPAEVEDLLRRLDSPEDTTGLIVDKARELLLRVRAAHKYRLLPLGAALGTVRMGRPRSAGEIFGGRPRTMGGLVPEDSDRGEFNCAWPMEDIRPFPAPVPMRGSQGFFDCTIQEAA
jgi:hypothetical protein